MKKITLLFALLISSIGFSQQTVIEDFEGSPTIEGFEGLTSATIQDDPATGGTNGKTFQLVTSTTGNGWQGAQVDLATGTMADLTTDKTMSVDIYSTTAFSVMAKVEDKVSATPSPAAANTQSHSGSGWETITFTFTTGSDGTATANGVYSRIVFFPNRNATDSGWNAPAADLTVYIDNITSEAQIETVSTQEVVEDFEGTPTVEGFEGLASATIQDDPATGGTNGKTFQLVTSTTGNGWQGAQVDLASGTMSDFTTDKTMTVDVYSTTAFSMMAKVEDKVSATPSPAAANTQSHSGSGWETLTYTFTTGSDGTATANGLYSRIVFFPNRNATDNGWNTPAVDITIYIDNITSETGTATPPVVPAPTTAAPTPPARNAWDVISLFSNAYTDKENVTFGTDWDQGDINDVTVAGDDVKKLTFGNFVALDFSSAKIDLSEFTHFHIDVWTETETLDKSFNHKFSNHAGGTVETSAIQFSTTNASIPSLPNPNPGEWISYDIPFTSWVAAAANGVVDRNEIAQYIISSNLGLVYVDNIYVYRAATASVDKNNLLNVSLSPSPAINDLRISAQSTIENVSIYNVLGKTVLSAKINKKEDVINVSSLNTGVYILKYTINNAVGTMKFIKE